MKKLLIIFTIGLLSWIAGIPTLAQTDSLLHILKDELWIEFKELQSTEHPPYFMEFVASDSHTLGISSLSGYTMSVNEDRSRSFSPNIRIGSYEFDNSHTFQNGMPDFNRGTSLLTELPLDNRQDAIRYAIWETTNDLYRETLNTYLNKLDEHKPGEIYKTADFSREEQIVYVEPPIPDEQQEVDLELWKNKMNKYSAVFNDEDEIFMASANFMYSTNRSYLVNTEKTEIVQNESLCVVTFWILARSTDDEYVPYMQTYFGFSPDRIPTDSVIMADCIEIREKVIALSHAPQAEPYSGPAILSAETSGVFFHEILGHRIEGHRMEEFNNSKTFKEKVGTLVLDKSISVYSDPTISEFDGKDLIGHYKYDDQGVAAQKVVNIENGILKHFLMSRKPIEGFEKSNGHGRGNLSLTPVARQSNLIIESDSPMGFDKLRKKLIKECKKQDREYGYFFKTVSGGLTNTMNYTPDYFNIFPLEVYRIYVDGRPDELVKGVNLIGTPLITFSEILGAGEKRKVFSGICGAESGSVPVSTVAPALLVRKIETQNQFSFKPEWPILPDPEKDALNQKMNNDE
ncbi:MAG: TldD/PmbA family protein [Bacteroidales bacterium]|nr:TldD/PmbA family protein [Bacteroidales bacterium]